MIIHHVTCPNGHKLKAKRKFYLLAGLTVVSLSGLLLIAWVVFRRDAAPPPIADVTPDTDHVPVESQPSDDAATVEAASDKRKPSPLQVPTEDIEDIQEKLRRIGLAFHMHYDTFRYFAPPRADTTTDSTSTQPAAKRPPPSGSKPTNLSWRVHLLPFLDQRPLYDHFKLDEPWDSPHNKALLEHMPEIYRIGSSEEPTTRFQVITGPEMLFGNPRPSHFRDIVDGPLHTILTLVTGPDLAVPWTKPDELTLDPNAPLASLGTLPDRLVPCVTAAGEPLIVRDIIEPADFLALATPRGGEIIDAGTYRRRYEESLRKALEKAARDLEESASETDSDIHAKLQAIAFAFLAHNGYFGMFTQPASQNEFGSGLSWRVHLLPFLGEEELYRKFHLDEAWDSPHNSALLAEIPDVYRFDDSNQTRIRVFAGPEMLFGTGRPMSLGDISGPGNTLLAVVVGPSAATAWTRPEGLPFEPESVAAAIASVAGGPIEGITADGGLLTLPGELCEKILPMLITPRKSEIVDVAALRAEHGPNYQPDAALAARIHKVTKTKSERSRKLKSIALAMHNYHDVFSQFPPGKNANFYDEDGKPNLSWRVHLLPFLDQQPLYDHFKLDEPWDSPHNIALLDKMPDIFRDLEDDLDGTKTRFVTFTGPNTPFSQPDGPSMRDFRDGISSTILVVMCGQDKAVLWTKPEDIPFDPNAPVGCLGELGVRGIFHVRADGTMNLLKANIPPQWFQAIVTPAGDERLSIGLANFGLR